MKFNRFIPTIFLLSPAFLVTISSESTEDRVIEEKWETYIDVYNKNYKDEEEAATRRANFIATEAMINDHNSDPNATFFMLHNRFSDWDENDLAALLGTVKPSSPNQTVRSLEVLDRAAPSAFNWYGTGAVNSVKNQARCGSCWAFSTVASFESAYFIKYGTSIRLSDQQLVSCDGFNGGCNGGWPYNAMWYFALAGGALTESAYPYTSGGGARGGCLFSSTKIAAKVAGFGRVRGSIESALVQYGVLSVSMDASRLSQYSGGIFGYAGCGSGGLVNHAVNLVGYGAMPDGTKVWMVRNSWGTNWGVHGGYFWIQRGVNMCNIESHVFAMIAQ